MWAWGLWSVCAGCAFGYGGMCVWPPWCTAPAVVAAAVGWPLECSWLTQVEPTDSMWLWPVPGAACGGGEWGQASPVPLSRAPSSSCAALGTCKLPRWGEPCAMEPAALAPLPTTTCNCRYPIGKQGAGLSQPHSIAQDSMLLLAESQSALLLPHCARAPCFKLRSPASPSPVLHAPDQLQLPLTLSLSPTCCLGHCLQLKKKKKDDSQLMPPLT